MLTQKELRIGNLVCGNMDDGVYWVDSLDNKDMELYGIPIDEKVLENSGFVFQTWQWVLESITLHKDSCWWYSIDNFGIGDGGSKYREISHVHELQNLYFIIEGKELQIGL